MPRALPSEAPLIPSTHDTTPEPPERRPRIGELLTRSGLLTDEQLEESLVIARASGKTLGTVLVENGLVSPHSVAMALADQHGGPLKTEFGFATGRAPVVYSAADTRPSSPPPQLRLAPSADDAPESPTPIGEGSAVEDELATVRDELAAALADAEVMRATIETQGAALKRATATADELRERVAGLDDELREARVPVVPPIDPQVDELKAVIELQEQALAAASAREQELESRAVAAPSQRSYSDERHLLFAPADGGYELLERSGPAPAVGSLVQLSGSRTCRVTRHGPSPYPGARAFLEACAYLEPLA